MHDHSAKRSCDRYDARVPALSRMLSPLALACALTLHAGCGEHTPSAGATPAKPSVAAAPSASAGVSPATTTVLTGASAPVPLPGKSIYHLTGKLVDQDGKETSIDAARGHPVLVAMIYASCTSICPMVVADIKRVESVLTPADRSETRVLLVSLNPEQDTPEKLAEFRTRQEVDFARWSFTRTSESMLQELAAVLGVRYRRLANGEVSHSAIITLLDREGVPLMRSEGSVKDPSGLALAIARTLATPPRI